MNVLGYSIENVHGSNIKFQSSHCHLISNFLAWFLNSSPSVFLINLTMLEILFLKFLHKTEILISYITHFSQCMLFLEE